MFTERLYKNTYGRSVHNTAMTTKWLVQASPTNIAPGFRYWGTILAELWGDFEDMLRTGQPQTKGNGWHR